MASVQMRRYEIATEFGLALINGISNEHLNFKGISHMLDGYRKMFYEKENERSISCAITVNEAKIKMFDLLLKIPKPKTRIQKKYFDLFIDLIKSIKMEED